MVQRVYIDTSVIGGCFDEEFKTWSDLLIKEIIFGQTIAIISDVTIDEIQDAPKPVQEKLEEIIRSGFIELIASDQETQELAEAYINEKAVSGKFFEDALHIAMATINKATVLASWNFKHIVNLERIRQYNAVNIKNGYSLLEIRSPREIVKIEENE
jgi:predicted nucleic acid-binding protein